MIRFDSIRFDFLARTPHGERSRSLVVNVVFVSISRVSSSRASEMFLNSTSSPRRDPRVTSTSASTNNQS